MPVALAWLFHNVAMSACNSYPVFQLPKSFLFLECIIIYDIYLDCCRIRLEHAR